MPLSRTDPFPTPFRPLSDSLQRLTNRIDALSSTTYWYNNQGLLTTVSNGVGQVSKTVFNNEDLGVYVTDANGVTVTNVFDNLNRLLTRTYPDTGVEKFTYSARGLIYYTNQIPCGTAFVYDEARRKIYETNANTEVLQFTYNAGSDLRTLTDGKGQVTKWGYDSYGRVTSKTNQAGTQILTYLYDANSRLTNRWSSAKGNTKYTYDPVGNLTKVDYPASTDITLSYDALNRATNMVDAIGTTKYTYNAASDLLTEDNPFSSTDTVTYTYHGNVPHLRTALSLAQPTSAWTNGYTYDAARRLSALTSQAGTFTYSYLSGVGSATTAASLTKKLALPNTSYITNAYDTVARLMDTWLKTSGNVITAL